MSCADEQGGANRPHPREERLPPVTANYYENEGVLRLKSDKGTRVSRPVGLLFEVDREPNCSRKFECRLRRKKLAYAHRRLSTNIAVAIRKSRTCVSPLPYVTYTVITGNAKSCPDPSLELCSGPAPSPDTHHAPQILDHLLRVLLVGFAVDTVMPGTSLPMKLGIEGRVTCVAMKLATLDHPRSPMKEEGARDLQELHANLGRVCLGSAVITAFDHALIEKFNKLGACAKWLFSGPSSAGLHTKLRPLVYATRLPSSELFPLDLVKNGLAREEGGENKPQTLVTPQNGAESHRLARFYGITIPILRVMKYAPSSALGEAIPYLSRH
ncbi:hypothetical protein EDC04DRAFT_2597688 [Pisolithus marmoratus]|nr:hypothetical protein EDC04DRAFT_2597688 [Pisolithus marmoratus]